MPASAASDIRAVVFDLDNTLLRSTIGARRGLLVAAKLISDELKKKGHVYSDRSLFSRLQWIDREMLRRKFLYNRDVWWKTLLAELLSLDPPRYPPLLGRICRQQPSLSGRRAHSSEGQEDGPQDWSCF
jgi:FMN phosphatase YigB (HAD superfamily)